MAEANAKESIVIKDESSPLGNYLVSGPFGFTFEFSNFIRFPNETLKNARNEPQNFLSKTKPINRLSPTQESSSSSPAPKVIAFCSDIRTN